MLPVSVVKAKATKSDEQMQRDVDEGLDDKSPETEGDRLEDAVASLKLQKFRFKKHLKGRKLFI